jgi:hypothetical protein
MSENEFEQHLDGLPIYWNPKNAIVFAVGRDLIHQPMQQQYQSDFVFFFSP